MAKFSKDGHTVETSFAPEIVQLRAEGFVEVVDGEPEPEPAPADEPTDEAAKPAPVPAGPKPAAKPAK